MPVKQAGAVFPISPYFRRFDRPQPLNSGRKTQSRIVRTADRRCYAFRCIRHRYRETLPARASWDRLDITNAAFHGTCRIWALNPGRNKAVNDDLQFEGKFEVSGIKHDLLIAFDAMKQHGDKDFYAAALPQRRIIVRSSLYGRNGKSVITAWG
ncbi:hypothetical protein GG851_18915 [Bordetella petrii]|nr:hypothetical protein [Bordetella petrii]